MWETSPPHPVDRCANLIIPGATTILFHRQDQKFDGGASCLALLHHTKTSTNLYGVSAKTLDILVDERAKNQYGDQRSGAGA